MRPTFQSVSELCKRKSIPSFTKVSFNLYHYSEIMDMESRITIQSSQRLADLAGYKSVGELRKIGQQVKLFCPFVERGGHINFKKFLLQWQQKHHKIQLGKYE